VSINNLPGGKKKAKRNKKNTKAKRKTRRKKPLPDLSLFLLSHTVFFCTPSIAFALGAKHV